jgi:hypothetical protein
MDLLKDNSFTKYVLNQKKKVNQEVAWFQIVDSKDVKRFIIDLNTNSQLFDQGINSEGVPLKAISGSDSTPSGYKPLTIQIKSRNSGKGGKTSNITLYDTGDYYESHKVTVDSKGFIITANPQKTDSNLFDRWGEEIVGLTDESLQRLINLLTERYKEYTRDFIFKT